MFTQSNIRSVVEDMRTLAAKYKMTFGRAPIGYVMGLKDYLVLKNELEHLGGAKAGSITSLDGLPLQLKVSSGIELLIDLKAAMTIASQKTLKDKTDLIKVAIVR